MMTTLAVVGASALIILFLVISTPATKREDANS